MVRKYINYAGQAVKSKTLKFRKAFRKHSITAIVAALGFLIALSWRDFISDTVNTIVSSLGVSEKLYLYKLLSAIIITILAIVGIMIISKLEIKEKEQEKALKK
ncbi:hypothetical protein CL621_00400 [archaeon]|jgi:Na+/H+ antiporter NhaC|nr:hypothetical protein [archaeon]|tara:strand:- start:220 stop:531 length:312 start_codon:yes stop_codon:yes gene_type:complete